MRSKLMTVFCQLVSLFMLILISDSANAQGRADSLRENRKQVSDWHSQLGLSEKQQGQLKEMEDAFRQKISALKQDGRTGKEKSTAFSGVYAWRDAEIAKILTPDQLQKYREKEDVIRKKATVNLDKIKSDNKKKINTSNK